MEEGEIMTSSIDDRVVNMQFNNETFERKMSDTIKSLDALKRSLDFANSTRSMGELDSASKKIDMSHLGSAVDGISSKFIAMSTIAVTALAHITSSALHAASNITGAFTFKPIHEGFQEFETNMNSIQTILANTDAQGVTLDQVNNALDTLNQYSDKTIYNFSQMARNIGTFTAAGVDLDTSVNSIKGIANLAAVSGSNAEQASSAMYQLSQAIATGTVRLIDWNSVVNAGMGGEVFQRALFTTGQALGTLKSTRMGQTFDEWTAAGNSFRGSLEENWLTSEVLTTTLQGFTGDMTEAQLLSIGFTQQQAAEILRMGQIATEAATEVKTLTQLFGTVKESIASGWSQSFRLIIGDFEESKELFTGINNFIGDIVKTSADSRNQILTDWKAFGARDALIESLKLGLQAIGRIIQPIHDAFRDIFPPMTAERLIILTDKFRTFMRGLQIGKETMLQIHRIFRGVFAGIEIGIQVIKGIAGVFKDLFDKIVGGRGGQALEFLADLAGKLTVLNTKLTLEGGLTRFFDKISDAIQNPIKYIERFQKKLRGMLEGDVIPGAEGVQNILGRIGDRLSTFQELVQKVADAWDWLGEKLRGIVDVLEEIWDYVSAWFSDLGSRLADSFSSGDFDAAVDIVNVGLLGGILFSLQQFFSHGLAELGLGANFMDHIRDALGSLTGTLQAMQTNLQAEALQKIAIAIGILTASVIALSLIDSEALTKAMVALGIGFGQLMAAMSIMNQLTTGVAAAKMAAFAGGLILMAAAAGVLSIAITNLSQLSWEELAKGLLGVGAALVMLAGSTRLLSTNSAGLMATGVAMIPIALALIVMSKAVKEFAEMEWESMAQGLVGVAGALTALVTATRLMPSSGMIASGIGLVILAGALRLMKESVEAFADMPWQEMGEGLGAIGAALLVVAGAMHLMPPGLPITAFGVLILSGALLVMAEAVEKMGAIAFGTMAKGIGAIAVMLSVLAFAMGAMTGATPGALALVIVSGALMVLTEVLKELSVLSLGEIAAGIGTIAAVLAVLGIAAALMSPITPALLGLAFAMALMGGAFALFGAGAWMVAKAFQAISEAGQTGINVLMGVIDAFLDKLPQFVSTLVSSLMDMITEILEATPALLEALKVLLIKLADTFIEVIPKFAEVINVLIGEWLALIRERFPDIITTGYEMLMAWLSGLRDNMGEITTMVADIITNFLDALSLKVPEIIDSVYNLVIAIMEGVANKMIDVWKILLPKGAEFLRGLIVGLGEKIGDLNSWFLDLPGKIIGWIEDAGNWLIDKGMALIGGILTGIGQKIGEIRQWFIDLPGKIKDWIGAVGQTLKDKGTSLLAGLLGGLRTKAVEVMDWFQELPGRITRALGNIGNMLLDVGRDIVEGLKRGLSNAWHIVADWFHDKMNDLLGIVGRILDLGSPSKEFFRIGGYVMQGLVNGLEDGWPRVTRWLEHMNLTDRIINNTTDNLNAVFNSIVAQLGDMDEFNPVITPVLDLTRVQSQAKTLNGFMRSSSIAADISYDQARQIASFELDRANDEPAIQTVPSEVTFEQNIYAPTALSTNDIYRNTKSQIALAKEELNI